MLSRFKRAFLLTLLVLTGLAAILIAMAVFRAGHRPDALQWALQWALLGALAHGLMLLVSFAAFTALDRPRIRILALGGMLLAALMLLLVSLTIWWQIAHFVPGGVGRHFAGDPMQQVVITGLLTAALFCIIPFVLVPQIQRIGRIVQLTSILYLSVAYLAVLLWLWHIDTQRIEEVVATLLIPAGACMLGVFALHKFLEIRRPAALVSVPPAIHIRCPRCQKDQTVGLGASRCTCCRLKFSIEVEEPVCPNCHFNLHGLTRPICPVCGHCLDQEEVPVITVQAPAKLT